MKKKLTTLYDEFFKSEHAAGVILIACTLVSMTIANSPFGMDYLDFWHTKVGVTIGSSVLLKYSLQHWINDGLMAIFFLLIGLEIERELYAGELSVGRNALLPVFAAIGGMATPALLHFLLNWGSATQRGIGIPIATDIAFALGILALLGNKIPVSLRIFLTALAIIDDLGAIIVIALFYVNDFSLPHFLAACAIFVLLLAFNRLGVHRLPLYLLPGCFMWYFLLRSGIHASIAGVLLAFAIPFARGTEQSPSYRLQHYLHKTVAFLVMPLFALANTGVVLPQNWLGRLTEPNSIGIFLGLFAGKATGIFLFTYLAVKMGISRLPRHVSWRHILGAGFLGGIGFTMSIFITLLAFDSPEIIESSKITILLTSLLAGTTGYLILAGTKTSRRSV